MTHEDQFSARHRTLDTLQEGIVITGGLRNRQLLDLGYPCKSLWVIWTIRHAYTPARPSGMLCEGSAWHNVCCAFCADPQIPGSPVVYVNESYLRLTGTTCITVMPAR